MTRKILFCAAIFVVTLAVMAQPSGVVYAATCYGATCNGTWPHLTGCDVGAFTVRTKYPDGTLGNSKVELRKSDTCMTFWSRTTNISGFWYYMNATLKNWYYTASSGNPGQQVWTRQRYGSNGFQACGYVSSQPMNYPITAPYYCTSTY